MRNPQHAVIGATITAGVLSRWLSMDWLLTLLVIVLSGWAGYLAVWWMNAIEFPEQTRRGSHDGRS